MAKKKSFLEMRPSDYANNYSYRIYYNALLDMSLGIFEWMGLPNTCDPRFLELQLNTKGECLFFEDEEMGYLTLPFACNGPLDIYNKPMRRRAYANNGYQYQAGTWDSTIIYNNLMRYNSIPVINFYAQKLWNLDRTIDVNCNAQRTPIMIVCDENERLTMENLYQTYTGNAPVIWGNKALNTEGIKALNTQAPYLADKLYTLKMQVWNEALSFLGIINVDDDKKERLLTDEVMFKQGDTLAYRHSRLTARQQACEEINQKFDLNVWCEERRMSMPPIDDVSRETLSEEVEEDVEIYN